ncbi:hypothetical protein TL16_g10882 [Triparma laevis f. inornata]|uniref:Protein kinase domain-containing protein n=1 Tax=Triparma laevis f. inornata TaxID=1714386 RepID=A0A9W7BGK5_9STRA|nr:hypothetical protein TL16_g10882 [Triparma laevis f. inornata]
MPLARVPLLCDDLHLDLAESSSAHQMPRPPSQTSSTASKPSTLPLPPSSSSSSRPPSPYTDQSLQTSTYPTLILILKTMYPHLILDTPAPYLTILLPSSNPKILVTGLTLQLDYNFKSSLIPTKNIHLFHNQANTNIAVFTHSCTSWFKEIVRGMIEGKEFDSSNVEVEKVRSFITNLMKQQLESLEEIDIVNVITELEIYLKNDQTEDDVSDLPSNLIGKAESDRMREDTIVEMLARSSSLILNEEEEDSSSISSEESEESLDSVSSNPNPGSRYSSDFKELQILGSGGGGSVWKVKNRLDKRLYAVKKIKLRPEQGKWKSKFEQSNRRLRREVRSISRLESRWICRYYQGWVEGGGKEEIEEEKMEDSRHMYLNETDAGRSEEGGWWNDDDDEDNDEDDDEDIDESYESSDSEEWSDSSEVGVNHLKDLHASAANNPLNQPLLSAQTSTSHTTSSPKTNSTPTLYIQMEYYPSTLLHYMKDKAGLLLEKNKTKKIYILLRQITLGLIYVHGKGVIHRDLKPGNVFLDKSGECRIGDFGLATKGYNNDKDDLESLNLENLSKDKEKNLTTGVGTAFYRSPEVESGQPYTSTSDVFSLGIMLYEMCRGGFNTYMERASELGRLRGEGDGVIKYIQGVSPGEDPKPGETSQMRFEDIDQMKEFPNLKQLPIDIPIGLKKLITWMTSRSSSSRPSGKEILSCNWMPREVDVSSKYIEEAMSVIGSSSEGYNVIVKGLFDYNVKYHNNSSSSDNSNLINLAHERITSTSHRYNVTALRRTVTKKVKEYMGNSFNNMADYYQESLILSTSKNMELLALRAAVGTPNSKINVSHLNASLSMASALRYSLESSDVPPVYSDSRVVKSLEEGLKTQFRLRGAEEVEGDVITNSTTNYGNNANKMGPCVFLTRGGFKVELRTTFTKYFAEAMSKIGPLTLQHGVRIFSVGSVYNQDCSKDRYAVGTSRSAEYCILGSEGEGSELIHTVSSCLEGPWFLRLNWCEIRDAVIEMIGGGELKGHTQSVKKILRLFSMIMPPKLGLETGGKKQQQGVKNQHKSGVNELDMALAELKTECPDLSDDVIGRVRVFLGRKLAPVGLNFSGDGGVVDGLTEGIKTLLKSYGGKSACGKKILKAYKTAEKGIENMSHFHSELTSVLDGDLSTNIRGSINPPVSVVFDLGLKHREGVYGSGLIFNCISLLTEGGCKVAEGGNFSHLINHLRPKSRSNFFQPSPHSDYTGTSSSRTNVNQAYSLRFFVARLVVLSYQNKWDSSKKGILPFQTTFDKIKVNPHVPLVVILSPLGFDKLSHNFRYFIATRLWESGIRAEYESNGLSVVGNTLDKISKVCEGIGVEFLVLVNDNYDSNNCESFSSTAVKLKRVTGDEEEDVQVDSLADIIYERLQLTHDSIEQNSKFKDSNRVKEGKGTNMMCYYVGSDGFHRDSSKQLGGGKQVKVPIPILKIINTARDRLGAEIRSLHMSNLGVFIFSVGMFQLRTFGTGLTLCGLRGIDKVISSMTGRFVKTKPKVWKNFRHGFTEFVKNISVNTSVSIVLYSQSEGGYDVVGVETGEGFKNEEAEEWLDGMEGAKVRREEREAVEEAQETESLTAFKSVPPTFHSGPVALPTHPIPSFAFVTHTIVYSQNPKPI